MTKDKAIEVATRLAKAGYFVSLMIKDMESGGHGYVDPTRDPDDGLSYDIQIREMSLDKVDLRALVELADELEVDMGMSPVHGAGVIYVSDMNGRQSLPEAVAGRRRHPR